MESRRDLSEENVEIALGFFVPYTNDSNEPNGIQKPEINSNLTYKQNKSIGPILTSERHLTVRNIDEVSCVGAINKTCEELLFHCSKTSLNINHGEGEDDSMEFDSLERKDQINLDLQRSRLMDERLIDQIKYDTSRPASVISTSSSSSSTKEMYLPSVTCSNGTVRIASCLSQKQGSECSKVSVNLQENINNLPIVRMMNESLNSNSDFPDKNFNNKDVGRIIVLPTEIQNIYSERSETDSSKCEYIKISNKLNEIVELQDDMLNDNEIKKPSNNFQEIDMTEEKSNLFEHIQNQDSSKINPEWMNEIINNKLIMKQDVIEKDFSECSSNSNCYSSIKNTEDNSLQDTFTASHKAGRSQDNSDKITTKKKCSYYIPVSSSRDVNKNNFYDLQKSIVQSIRLGNNVKQNINNNVGLNSSNMPEIIHFTSAGKYKKMPGLFELPRNSPITKLVILSNVISESSEDNVKNINKMPSDETILSSEINPNRDSSCIYNESLPTDNSEFQKIRKFYAYKNVDLGLKKTHYSFNLVKHKSDVTLKVTNKQSKPSISQISGVTRNITETPGSKQHEEQMIMHKEDHRKELSFHKEAENISLIKKKLILLKGKIMAKNGHPAVIYNTMGFPLTDLKGRILINNIGIPLLNLENCDEVKNKTNIYCADNIGIENPDFDPSKRPMITTLVKITDQAKNPACLYNNLGHPLTDEDGLLLHDLKGKILVTVDSKFFPLCCKTGLPIYLRNGTSWLSQRCKFLVTTQHKGNGNKSIGTSMEADTNLKRNENLTNEVREKYIPQRKENRKIFSKIYSKHKLIPYRAKSENYIERGPRNYSKVTNILQNLIYNKIMNRRAQIEFYKERGLLPTTPINNIDYPYEKYNYVNDEYEENFVDKNYPVNKFYDEPFNDLREQEFLQALERPERPYCDQELPTTHLDLKLPRDILKPYRWREPLLKIIRRNDIRACNLNNEVPAKSDYYLPVRNNYEINEQITNYIPSNYPTKRRDKFYNNPYLINKGDLQNLDESSQRQAHLPVPISQPMHDEEGYAISYEPQELLRLRDLKMGMNNTYNNRVRQKIPQQNKFYSAYIYKNNQQYY